VSDDPQRIADLVEIQQLCARYMAYAAQQMPDQWLDVLHGQNLGRRPKCGLGKGSHWEVSRNSVYRPAPARRRV
jgi:hypothetical protein